MTNEEMMQTILEKITGLQGDMNDMKADMNDMKADIASLKKTALKVENEVIPTVNLLLENYTDLNRKIDESNNIKNRVEVLEFDMKLVKTAINTSAS